MNQKLSRILAFLVSLLLAWNSIVVDAAEIRDGEFVAGSFMLTQKSLNEAPYRYAGVLRKALDKIETKDPPNRSDEQNCDVRYRIRPSGETIVAIDRRTTFLFNACIL
jgi:hypothetical protein